MSTDNSSPAGSQHPDSHRSIIKSTSIISLGTLSSRILGFIRDVILANLLGTGFKADAFFVASKIPNLFRDFVGEGAMNAAIVPVLSEYKQNKEKEAFWNFISIVFALCLIVLSIVTILGIIFTPAIVRIMAPGFMAESGKLELTIELTRWMFPYLIFIGLTSYLIGILYSFRSFMAPAFTPCLLNVAMIISALIASHQTKHDPVFILAIGVLAGGLLQLLGLVGSVRKTGIRFRRPQSLDHPGARKIGKLLLPRMFGSGVYQLSIFIDTFCASISSVVGPGGISAIYYANRIIQFPMGIFSVAMASAILPSLSGHASNNDTASIKKTLSFSLENIFFIMCPTTVVIIILANPIIRVLFERGEFDLYSTQITASVLAFSAIGLFSFGGIKILVTAFYALQDTKTPVKVAALCLFINAALNFILMFPLKVGGIALSSSIAGTIDYLILLYIMDKRLGGLNAELLGYFTKVTIASGLTGIFEYGMWHIFFFNETAKLFIIGGGGFIFYGAVCYMMNIEQARKIVHWILRKKSASSH